MLAFIYTIDCVNQVLNLFFPLLQIPRLRPTQYALIKKSQRTVSRAYGGCLCAPCTKSRVLRAFLSEENKLVKAAQALRAKEAAKAKKATKKADAKKSKKKVKA